MIWLVESPEITWSRDVKPVYVPIPLPGAPDEEYKRFAKNWGRPVDMKPSGVLRLSVRLTVEFDQASRPTVDALHKALRAVLMEAQHDGE